MHARTHTHTLTQTHKKFIVPVVATHQTIDLNTWPNQVRFGTPYIFAQTLFLNIVILCARLNFIFIECSFRLMPQTKKGKKTRNANKIILIHIECERKNCNVKLICTDLKVGANRKKNHPGDPSYR